MLEQHITHLVGNMTCSSAFYRHLFSTTSVMCRTTNTELEKITNTGSSGGCSLSQLVRSWIDTAPDRQRWKCNAKASLLWKSSLSLFLFLTLQGSCDFMAEISLIRLEKLQSQAFPAGVRIEEPITALWVVTGAVGDWRPRKKSTKRKKGMLVW